MKNVWLLLALLVAVSVLAKDEVGPPLPKALVEAKTVFLRDETGSGIIFADAYKALKKWNRFQFVDDYKDADLVFVVVYTKTYMGDVGFGVPTKTRDVRESTVLNILDRDNKQLMSIAADSFFPVNGGTSVINQLRKRLEPSKKK
jgi:hypothetical protein